MGKPQKEKAMIELIMMLTLFFITMGIFEYFISKFDLLEKVSIGFIVVGLGMFDFLRTAVETFENHRKE